MGDSVSTQLDDTVRVSDDTRAAAVRVMQRLGAADLLEMLGLALPAPKPVRHCPRGHVLPSHGVCRRSEDCRIAARAAGHVA